MRAADPRGAGSQRRKREKGELDQRQWEKTRNGRKVRTREQEPNEEKEKREKNKLGFEHAPE
jgi:hypothetical protein